MSATLRRKFRHELVARFGYDAAFNFALVAAGLAAVVHIAWFVTSFVAFRRRIDAATMVIIDWDPSVFMMHTRIGLALFLSVAGLWSRRVIGLFLSLLALVWAGLEYIAWFLWSIRIKSNADIETFPSSVAHASNLYGATPWNVVVLVLVLAVLVWEIGQLIRIAKARRIQWLGGVEIRR